MARFAMRMRIREGCEEEYARVHAAVYPELLAAFDRIGYQRYSIFVDGRDVFQLIDLDGDIDDAYRWLASQEPAQRWARENGHLLEADIDGRGRMIRMEEVFFHRPPG